MDTDSPQFIDLDIYAWKLFCPGSGMALGSDDEGGPTPMKPSTPLPKEIDCIDLDSDWYIRLGYLKPTITKVFDVGIIPHANHGLGVLSDKVLDLCIMQYDGQFQMKYSLQYVSHIHT